MTPRSARGAGAALVSAAIAAATLVVGTSAPTLSQAAAAAAVPAAPGDAGARALAAAAAEPGAVVSASGLVFRSLKTGTGPMPKATDQVRVHYRGSFVDGREFDSSYRRGKPATFPLDRVIRCWTEGLQRIAVGGSARLTCPAGIAYGERGAGGGEIPPNSVLRFEVELLAIEPAR